MPKTVGFLPLHLKQRTNINQLPPSVAAIFISPGGEGKGLLLCSALTAFKIYGFSFFFFSSSQQLRRNLIITSEGEETPRCILQLAGSHYAALAFPMQCLETAHGLALAAHVNVQAGF